MAGRWLTVAPPHLVVYANGVAIAISFAIICVLAGCFTSYGQAWNGGAPRSGTSTTSGTGLLNGEPRMTLN